MAESLTHRPKAVLALGATVIAMCLGIFAANPPQSQAFTTTVYCDGVTLGNTQICYGAPRTMYAVYGVGVQHSVCVFADNFWFLCSGGPGQGVYDAFGQNYHGMPGIQNNAAGANTVHGRAYSS